MVRTGLGSRIVPSLLVRDLGRTLDFYRRLGFEQTGAHPSAEAATWAEVRRDGIVLHLYVDPPRGTPTEPVMSGTFYLYPESVEALAEEWRDEVDFAWGPEEMDYGTREFAIRDPDGYLLAFTEEVVATGQ